MSYQSQLPTDFSQFTDDPDQLEEYDIEEVLELDSVISQCRDYFDRIHLAFKGKRIKEAIDELEIILGELKSNDTKSGFFWYKLIYTGLQNSSLWHEVPDFEKYFTHKMQTNMLVFLDGDGYVTLRITCLALISKIKSYFEKSIPVNTPSNETTILLTQQLVKGISDLKISLQSLKYNNADSGHLTYTNPRAHIINALETINTIFSIKDRKMIKTSLLLHYAYELQPLFDEIIKVYGIEIPRDEDTEYDDNSKTISVRDEVIRQINIIYRSIR